MDRVKRLSLLATLCFFVIFSGCSANTATDSKGNTKVVQMWHWLTDRADVLDSLAKEYYEKTGVEVRAELFAPSEAYSQKIIASAQTNTLPDIFGILGNRQEFANFILAGHVANLTDVMSAKNEDGSSWKDTFAPKALKTVTFESGNVFEVEPGIYGVPLDSTVIQFLYNKDIMEEIGADPERPPVTWQEFLELCRKAVEKGYYGLVSGFGEQWLIQCLAYDFAWNIMGERMLINTIKGKMPYNTPDWIKVFKLFEEMAQKDVFAPAVVTMDNKQAEQTFSLGKALFTFNGSWAVNVYKGLNPDLRYGVMLPPSVSNSNPVGIWGGAGTWLVVNAKSPRKEAAIGFLKWLTSADVQARLTKETNNIPANVDCMSLVEEPLRSFLQSMEYAYHPNTFSVQEDPIVLEEFNKGIQAIIIGTKTAEEVANSVDKAKKKALAREKNANK